MPTLPSNTKCAQLGCKNERSKYSSFCIDHGGRNTYKYETTEQRQEANAMYATAQWQSVRKKHLSLQPLCQACLLDGIVTSATEVDHVIPWRKIGKEAFYRNVFQCLCHDHHSSKTQLEKRGIFRHYAKDTHKDYALHDYYALLVLEAL